MKASSFKDLTVREKKVEPIKYRVSNHAYMRLKQRWPLLFQLGRPDKVISALIANLKPEPGRHENTNVYFYDRYIIVVSTKRRMVVTVLDVKDKSKVCVS